MKGLFKDRLLLRNLALLIGAGILIYFFLDSPQCPAHYTQAQVDASNCIVGANIGLGLAVLFVLPVFIVALVLIVLSALRRLKKQK